jgi:hypothetical protein
MKNKLDEIGTVRNALAHFRPIKYDDIELIKQNIKHAFLCIEQCLAEMTQMHQSIPTNTEEDWYKNLTRWALVDPPYSYFKARQSNGYIVS